MNGIELASTSDDEKTKMNKDKSMNIDRIENVKYDCKYAFKQQLLKAWQPILSLNCAIILYIVFGIIFIIIGIV